MSVNQDKRIVERWASAFADGRLHHAFVLSGADSDVKIAAVHEFASRVFAGPRERTLARVAAGNHPDFYLIKPGEQGIGVDEVRELPRVLAFSPLESPRRFVVIEDADRMNTQAANAILKILEEPPGHTLFFLLCHDPGRLLPTVLSRCQVVRFFPKGDENVLQMLRERELANGESAAVAALADGSAARAQALLEREGGMAAYKAAAEALVDLWTNAPRVPSRATRWLETVEEADAELIADTWHLLFCDLTQALLHGKDGKFRFPEYKENLCKIAFTVDKEDVLRDCINSFSAINRFRVQREFHGGLKLGLTNLYCALQLFSLGKKLKT